MDLAIAVGEALVAATPPLTLVEPYAYGMYLHNVRACDGGRAGVFWASWAARMRNRGVRRPRRRRHVLRVSAAATSSRGAVEAHTPAFGRARCTSAVAAGVGERSVEAAVIARVGRRRR